MKVIRIITAVLILAALAIPVNQVFADSIMIAQNDNAGGTYNPFFEGHEFGQTFTPNSNCYLTSVSLYMNKLGSPTGSATVNLYATDSDLPTGSALSTSSVTAASIGASNAWVTFTFGTPYEMTAGTKYALVFDSTDALTLDDCFRENFYTGNAITTGDVVQYSGGWSHNAAVENTIRIYADSSLYIDPTFSYTAVTNIGTNSATVNAQIDTMGSYTNITGHYDYGTSASYGLETNSIIYTGGGVCNVIIGSLSPGVTYHYRYSFTVGLYNWNGTDQTFTTDGDPGLAITTQSATNIFDTGAKLWGSVDSVPNGTPSVDIRWAWGTTISYDHHSNWMMINGAPNGYVVSNLGSFPLSISGLQANTTYHFRIEAYEPMLGDPDNPVVGGDLTFTTTTAGTTPTPTPPYSVTNVETRDATATTEIEGGTYILNGYLYSIGLNSQVTVGFDFGTSQADMVRLPVREMVTNGQFTLNKTYLQPNTTYYFRAYAKGNKQEALGSTLSFTVAGTYPTPTVNPTPTGKGPTVSTYSATTIGDTYVTLNGHLTSKGDLTAPSVGFQWGTVSGRPYPYEKILGTMSALGDYSYTMPAGSLLPSTTYHFSAYAPEMGESWGKDLYFTTQPAGSPPISTTPAGTATSGATKVSGDLSAFFDNNGWGGPGMHLLIILICCIVSWFIFREKKIIAAAVCLVALGAGIFLFEDIRWMVILLALFASVAVGGFILKERRA